MKIFKPLTLVALLAMSLYACKKDDNTTPDPSPSTAATFNFEFENVDDQEVALDFGKVYVTETGDSVSFDFMRYWISNIEFIMEDGSVWKEKDSYRLIEKTDKMNRMTFSVEAPSGRYKSVRFSIGVDADHNSSLDSMVAELNPSVGMSWTWSTGYIFLKTEGTFYNSDSMAYQPYKYHLGMDANYKTITMDIPAVTEISGGDEVETHIVFHALKMFSSPNAMNLKANPALMVGPADQTAKAAENYSQAFELHHFMKK